MAKHVMKAGDLLPPLTVTCTDGSGAPVNLDEATSVDLYIRHPDGTLLVDGAAMAKSPQTGATLGKASHTWVAGQTDEPGDYDVEVVVQWPLGPQTFPSDGFGIVQITPSTR